MISSTPVNHLYHTRLEQGITIVTIHNQLPYISKPDSDAALARMEAWWHCAILDRPVVQVTAPKPPDQRRTVSHKSHDTLRERYMDVEYTLERAQCWIDNTYWLGEQFPIFWPNLGPEILSATLGAELEFGETTSWSIPCLHDWKDISELHVDPANVYTRTILEMTQRALDQSGGRYLTGITDIHPGADLAASLRDPQQLCLDLALEPVQVHRLMDQLRPSFFDLYELQHELMLNSGQTITVSWLPVLTDGKCYIPSCDFACTISSKMFKEFFLSEIVDEITWLDRSIFHLDGPQALHHLDTLLDIPKLNAIQFVCGAGHEPSSDWMQVFQRIQRAGKGIHVTIAPSDIDPFIEALKPEGVMLHTWSGSLEEAEAIINKVTRWGR